MKAWPLLAIMAVGAACSQVPDSPYLGSNQPRVVGDGISVTVVNVRNKEEAQPWATAYCAKRSMAAHFLSMELYKSLRHQPTDSAFFECVTG